MSGCVLFLLFRCDEEGCTMEYHSKLGLMRHMVAHKKRKILNLICPYEGCGEVFNWQSRYDQHIDKHKGIHGYCLLEIML